MSYADAIASVTITRSTRTPSQQGFGTPLAAVFHTRFVGRVRSYDSPDALLADGFLTTDPAYRIAQAVFAQDPAPPMLKIGRRASAFTQVVHLTPGAPAVGEVFTAKIDGLSASATADGTPTLSEVCTALADAVNALGVEDAIIATGGSAMLAQTLSGAAFDGSVGAGAISPPRALVLTLSSSGDWLATTATVTGKDIDGNTITDTFAIPGEGGASVLGAGGKHFAKVTSVAIPAQDGPGGAFVLGTRAPVTAVATGGTHVVCTAPVAGELHSYEITSANVTLADHTADPGLAADLAAIYTADADFYGLLLDSQGAAEITAAATWTESAKLEFVWQSADSGALDPDDDADIFSTTHAAGYVRSGGIFHPGLYTNWIAAAWMGEEFPKDAGASTWMFKSLAGVTVYDLTSAQRAALEAKDGNHYLLAGGVPITGPGHSASGEWLDVVRDLDWLTARLRERSLGVFIANDKVPFTDDGISLVLTALRAQLTEAVDKTVLAKDPKFTLTAPRAAAVPAASKRARRLPDVKWTAKLASAIHGIDISGLVSL